MPFYWVGWGSHGLLISSCAFPILFRDQWQFSGSMDGLFTPTPVYPPFRGSISGLLTLRRLSNRPVMLIFEEAAGALVQVTGPSNGGAI